MNWIRMANFCVSSLMLIAIAQVESLEDLPSAADAARFSKSQELEKGPTIALDPRQASQSQAVISHPTNPLPSHHAQPPPASDPPQKKTSAKQHFMEAFKILKKILKFMTTGLVTVHSSTKGSVRVPGFTASRYSKSWPEMQESMEDMKLALDNFKWTDIETQSAAHSWLQKGLLPFLSEPDLESKRKKGNALILSLRNILENLPSSSKKFSTREQQRQMLTVKLLCLFGKDPNFSDFSRHAIDTAATTLGFIHPDESKLPTLMPYIQAARDVMPKHAQELSQLSHS